MRKLFSDIFAENKNDPLGSGKYFKPFKKLTAILLVFLFLITPLTSISAQTGYSRVALSEAGQDIAATAPSDPILDNPVVPDTINSESPVVIEDPTPITEDDQIVAEPTVLEETPNEEVSNPDDEKIPPDEKTDSASSQSASSYDKTDSVEKYLKLEPNSAGALTFNFPIQEAPGRNGMQPNFELSYSSQSDEANSIFGYGWSGNIPYIERINKFGSDKLYSTTTPAYFRSSIDGDLATTTATSTYASKIDNGDFHSYTFSNDQWSMLDKNGTQYKFGHATSTRQDDPNNSSRIYKWMLQEVRDTNDNYVKYEYYKDSGQIYPSVITYTGNNTTDGILTLEFSRQSRNDNATSSLTSFPVKTNYRINEIQAKINGTWAKKYALGYTNSLNGHRSLLDTITESGQDESSNVTTLPATDFNYGDATEGWTLNEDWEMPMSHDNSYKGFALADVNGDGLTDMIQSLGSIGNPSTALNNGDGTWTASSTWDMLFYLDDYGTGLADFNGDGLVDIFHTYNTTNDLYINNGSGWTLNANWDLPFSYDNSYKGYAAIDVNGDGLADMISANQALANATFLNNGNGTWTEDPNWDLPVDLDSYGVAMAELNGDGLVDVYCSYNGSNNVYLNNGNGWTLAGGWSMPMEHDNQFLGFAAADVNGDGLADMLKGLQSANPSKQTFLNNGDGTWTQDSDWLAPVSFDDYGFGIADLNGDGMTDMYRSYNTINSVSLNNSRRPDTLSQITSRYGGTITTTYKGSPQYREGSNLLNPQLPYTVQVVDTITTNDGLGVSGTDAYQYENGQYYFNNYADKKFAGFKTITKTDSAGNKVKTYFHQGNASDSTHGEYNDHISKVGKPYRIEAYDNSSNLYTKTINKWENYDLGSGANFIKLTQKIDSSYEGDSSHKDKAETYSYNNVNGDVTGKTEWGEVTGSDDGTFSDTGTDKFTTDFTYATSSTSTLMSLLSGKLLADQSANKVNESKYYYDGSAFGVVNKGNLTKEEKWKSSSNYVDTEMTYNSYGLLTQVKDPRDKATNFIYDNYNLYVSTSTNALSQSTLYQYDYSAGKPKQVTDPNGLVFQTVYDGMDRVKEEKQPDLTSPSTLVTKTAYVYTDTANATNVKRSDYLDATTTADTYSYLDGLGRLLQLRKEAEGSNFAVSDYTYNNRGLLQKESLPYFSSGSAKTLPITSNSLYSSYSYDPFQRITIIANAVGTTTNAYIDWGMTVTDARGKSKGLSKDAFGNLIRVDEHNSTSTLTTLYEYNGNGNLTKVTDALSNIRNFTYDGLGRRLTAQDAHASGDGTYGSYSYTYDNTGNMTQAVDPKSQTVNYTYDDINRPLTEDYTGQGGTETSYSYDSCTNGIGRLCIATSTDAVISTLYNALGLASRETKTVDSTAYQTDYTYDRQGNVLNITNPDSSQVKYEFNAAGLLEKVSRKESSDGSFSEIISGYEYSPLEKVANSTYASGISVVNSYDPTKLYRLVHRAAVIPESEGMMADMPPSGESGESLLDSTPVELYESPLYTDSDLISYWRFEGNSTDEKGAHSGATNNNITFGTNYGKYGQGASFNGSNSNIITSNSFTPPSALSVVAWVKPVAGDYRAVTSGTTGSIEIFVKENNKIALYSASNIYFGQSTGTIPNGQWSLIGVTYDNSTGAWVIYINGSASGSGTQAGSGFENSTLYMGSRSNGDYRYNGSLDELALFDRVLTADEMSDLYTGDWPIPQAGTPTISPNGGVYDFAQTITLTSTTTGASIYYTTNGSTPTASSTLYSSPFSLSQSATVKAVTTKSGYSNSEISSATFTIVDSSISVDTPGISYTYDANGNITQIVNTTATNASSTIVYIYDDLNRLTSASTTAATVSPFHYSYDYNALGNILSRTENGTSTSYSYLGNQGNNYANPHAVTNIGSATLAYDNNGNLTGDGTWVYTWNHNNQMTNASTTGTNVNFAYDHTGERVKQGNGATTTYYPTKFYNTNGTTPTKHIFANGELIATVEGTGATTTVYSVITDHLGGTNLVINDSDFTVVQLLDYYPYGSKRLSEGTDVSQREFIGEMYDESSGLSYLNARYYNGVNGKFTSQDPTFLAVGDAGQIKQLTGQRFQEYLSDPQAFNSYSYARNNPLRYNDASGLWFEEALSWINARTGIGQAVDNSATYNYMVEHPVQGGLIVAGGSAAILTGTSYLFSAGYTGIGISGSTATTLTTTGGTACAVGCEKATRLLNNTQSLMSSTQRSGIISTIENQKLQNIFSKLYQTSDSLPGGTAGAIKYTAETGKLVQGSNHIQKGYDSLRGLQNLLQNSNLSNSDRNIAQTLTNQLSEALSKVK